MDANLKHLVTPSYVQHTAFFFSILSSRMAVSISLVGNWVLHCTATTVWMRLLHINV